MKNFIQPGRVVTLPATAMTGVKSGSVLAVGSLIGVCSTDADANSPVEVATEGVFELPKAGDGAIDQGDAVYWASASSVVTKTGTDTPLGVATETAASTATVVRVKLAPEIAAAAALDGRVTALEGVH